MAVLPGAVFARSVCATIATEADNDAMSTHGQVYWFDSGIIQFTCNEFIYFSGTSTACTTTSAATAATNHQVFKLPLAGDRQCSGR
ncbi:MAG: hypothetical protein EA407_14165 [Rhodobacteraceae bacterium]|nr:MAG: hypothetical protein EA407_14165 [Paracoccaceae bacterium]